MADWLEVLTRECRRTSQASVARRLGVSAGLVNRVLKDAYPGDMARIRGLVEGAFMGATVDCPILSEIPRDRCLEHQRRPFAATNPARVALYMACRTCEHNITNGGD